MKLSLFPLSVKLENGAELEVGYFSSAKGTRVREKSHERKNYRTLC